MSALQRFEAAAECPAAPSPAGEFVRFADIEPALRDQARLQWVMPLIDGSVGPLADTRGKALFDCHQEGLRGPALVDAAMVRCPA